MATGRRRGMVGTSVLALTCLWVAIPASGAWPELLDKLPATPNALGLIEVARLRQLAEAENGGDDDEAKKAAKDLREEMTDDLRQIAVVAQIDPVHLESEWELALCDMTSLPKPQSLAKLEQGYVDRIDGKEVIWSSRQTYFIPMKDSTLGVVQPANRQLLSRWIRSWPTRSNDLPEFLRDALKIAEADVPVVLALDLGGAISPVVAKEKIATLDASLLKGARADDLVELLGELRGIIFAVQVKNGLRGRLRIDFGSSPAALREIGKPIVLEILRRVGASIPELQSWTASVSGNSFSLQGSLSARGLRELLSMLNSPTVAASATPSAAPAAPSPGETASPAPAASMGQASLRYYKSVQRIVEQCREYKAQTMGEKGMWNDRLSRKIDTLPILDVDPELLDYGANVASLLRGAGLVIRDANLQAGVDKIGQRYTTTSGVVAGYGGYAGYTGFVNLNVPTHYEAKINQQARQKGTSKHLENLKTIDDLTADIRRKMTERYRLEF